MPTDIVKRIDVAFPISGNDEFEAGSVELEPVSDFVKPSLVRDELPLSREDSTSFKLIHLLRDVPVGRQGTQGLLLRFCVIFVLLHGAKAQIVDDTVNPAEHDVVRLYRQLGAMDMKGQAIVAGDNLSKGTLSRYSSKT